MTTLYFDAFSGASGDMILGALVDLGGDFRGLRAALSRLGRGRFELRRRRVRPSGLAATKVDVRVLRADRGERSLREIARIVRGGGLTPPVRSLALEIFRRLCEAEGAAHGVPAEKVHLHEAGAIDAIADICGAAWLVGELAPGRILASPLNVGSGTLTCRHGTYPVPGPATSRLLRGIPIYAEGAPGERVTPTGAAILSTISSGFGPLPPIVIRGEGYGAGDTAFPDRPNVLRAILGDDAPAAMGSAGDVLVMEATIDDMNPQNYGYFAERAASAGALEVYFTPVMMKKGRPGTLVTLIAPPVRFDELSRALFLETTTIGFRWRREARQELDRTVRSVRTPYGTVRVKISSAGGERLQVQPEYEDCRRLAAGKGIPLKEIQAAALAAWRSGGRTR